MPGEPEPGLAPPTNSGSGDQTTVSNIWSSVAVLTDMMRRSSPASRSYVLGFASGRSTLTPTRHWRAPANRTPTHNSKDHGLRPQRTPSGRPLDKSGSFKDADMRSTPTGLGRVLGRVFWACPVSGLICASEKAGTRTTR